MPTGISYLDETWNVTTGCSHAGSPGCDRCYARRMATTRLRGRCGYPSDNPFQPTIHPNRLDIPLHWKKPRRIGVSFMGDLFHPDIPYGFVEEVFDVMGSCRRHTFLILTKRPEKILRFVKWQTIETGEGYLNNGNVWIGVSVENQQAADERIPILLQIPAAVRWVSVEPMLGKIDLSKYLFPYSVGFADHPDHVRYPIKLVICGAETGPGARPMDLAWARDLRDQCGSPGVPFYMKQVSGKQPIPPDLMVREFPK